MQKNKIQRSDMIISSRYITLHKIEMQRNVINENPLLASLLSVCLSVCQSECKEIAEMA